MNESRGLPIMIQGTASDVGKSLICTALCRIFMQDGWRVAPFKSQNMALNSAVTVNGKEIGRAQAVQAEAAGVLATEHMNPILLKPKGDMTSQVVVRGKPIGDMSAMDYRNDYIPKAITIVKESLDSLLDEFDVVVIEGAGSPAEINLKDRDIANMKVAELADAPVVLVADIDRGGVFATLVGTLELLEPHERQRVKGFIINKFRGDIRLLQNGLDWLEERTGIAVLGVIPYQSRLWIDQEDSMALEALGNRKSSHTNSDDTDIHVGFIRLPRLSNFTDWDPLRMESDVQVHMIQTPDQLEGLDAIVIPGTKNTVEDLIWLRETGLADAIIQKAKMGIAVIGICGGYQMLGRKLFDPEFVESNHSKLDGLGLLDGETIFIRDKRTVQVHGETLDQAAIAIRGYEIHMGRTERGVDAAFARIYEQNEGTESWHEDGAVSGSGTVMGTYLHGIFHNDAWRRQWINFLRVQKGGAPLDRTKEIHVEELRQAEFDRWAAVVRNALDMRRLYDILHTSKGVELR